MAHPKDQGWLEVDGKQHRVVYAECCLFVGELLIDFALDDRRYEDGTITLRCDEAVEYPELHGMTAEITDPRSSVLLNLDCVSFALNRLTFDITVTDLDGKHTIHLRISGKGEEWDILGDEVPRKIEFRGNFEVMPERCDCLLDVSTKSIPAKFVNFYLGQFGVPHLPQRATRDDVIRILGTPVRESEQAGTKHPQLNFIIPDWTVHNFETFGLHCFYNDGLLSHVMVVSRQTGPNGQSKLLME